MSSEVMRGAEACAELEHCVAAYLEWQRARPRLYVGQSHYSQTLVLRIIDALHRVMESVYDRGTKAACARFIEDMRKKLNERPPPFVPRTGAPKGALSF